MTLRIPDVSGMDTLTAALEYAKNGIYVIPVARDTKAPTVLGKDWPRKSSRDPEEIVAWFAGTDHALGMHVGRSGAVAFDVDHPEKMPEPLRRAIEDARPPFQSSRDNVPEQGHYIFLTPEGRFLGNGRGELGKEFGEIRGANGIVVLSPSAHTKPHGRYEWQQLGNVPDMPEYLSKLLPDGSPSESAVADAEVKRFLDEHAEGSKPTMAVGPLSKYREDLKGSSRHEALVEHLVWAMRETRLGFLNGHEIVATMRKDFLEAMAGETGRSPNREFDSVLAWAVGQALGQDLTQLRKDIEERTTPENPDWYELSEPETATNKPVVVDKPAEGEPEVRAPVVTEERPVRDTDAYWFYDDLLRKNDVDMTRLLKDITERMGPLAIGHDHRTWSYQGGVWREDQDAVRRRVYLAMGRRVKPQHWSTASQLLAHSPAVYELKGAPTEPLINFTNGMLEWETGELLPHDPAHLSTIQLPVAWNPDAECPQFDKWLNEVLSPDYAALAWQMIGYLMMSGNPLQVAFLFLGSGGNGKGTLMRVIKALLGEDNYSAVSLDDLTGNRFSAAQLYGKVANLAGDIDATFQESTARFKMLTGEDTFTAENKGQPGFRFINWAVPVFSANKLFGSADTSQGYLRRWIVMKFERSFTGQERIMHLEARFHGEMEGIARRGVEALHGLMRDGHFKSDGDIAEGQREFAENLDQVRQWVDQCCEPDDGSEERTALYDSYKIWADKTGTGRLSAKEFYSRLDAAGYPAVKVHGVRRHKGLRVVNMRMISTQLTDPMQAS